MPVNRRDIGRMLATGAVAAAGGAGAALGAKAGSDPDFTRKVTDASLKPFQEVIAAMKETFSTKKAQKAYVKEDPEQTWQTMKDAAQPFIERNATTKGRPTWAYGKDDKQMPSPEEGPEGENEDEQVALSFTARRFLYDPSTNMYVDITPTVRKSRKVYKSEEDEDDTVEPEGEFETAAGNPYKLHRNGGSDSVGLVNHEPKRKLANSFGKATRRPMTEPGPSRVVTDLDARRPVAKDTTSLIQDPDQHTMTIREMGESAQREGTAPAGPARRKLAASMNKANQPIRDKYVPGMEKFGNMSDDEIENISNEGGNQMINDWMDHTSRPEKFLRSNKEENDDQQGVIVSKSEANHEQIAEMMASQFGYKPQQVVDRIRSMNKSEAHMHSIEHGDLMELHQKNDGTYIIAPIGYGSVGDLALPVPSEYAHVFETDIIKSKIRADQLQRVEMRKSFVEVDSQYHYRDQMDTVLLKAYKFSKAEVEEGDEIPDVSGRRWGSVAGGQERNKQVDKWDRRSARRRSRSPKRMGPEGDRRTIRDMEPLEEGWGDHEEEDHKSFEKSRCPKCGGMMKGGTCSKCGYRKSMDKANRPMWPDTEDNDDDEEKSWKDFSKKKKKNHW